MATGWLAVFAALALCTYSVSGNMENKLISHLLSDYYKEGRPLKNSNNTLPLQFELSYIKINIDEKSHTETTIAYETQGWRDEQLVWEPENYGGLTNIIINKEYIWTPDITLYNSNSNVDVLYGQGNALVNHDGNVILVRNSKSTVDCVFDSLRFPFDSAKCNLKYGSWVYSSNKINLTLRGTTIDLSSFNADATWRLKDAHQERQETVYPCCPEKYITLVYHNQFLRRSAHYMYVLLLPTFLASLITCLLFLLPTHSSERVTLGVLSFFAFVGLLLYSSTLVPSWTVLPYFILYLAYSLVVITVFTFLNALIVRLSNPGRDQEVPKILRTMLFEIFARLFCMKSIVKRNRSRHLVAPEYEYQAQPNSYYRVPIVNEKLPLDPNRKEDSMDESVELPADGKQNLETDVAFIRAFTRRSWQKKKDDDWDSKLRREWEDVAKVTNAFFLCLYLPLMFIAFAFVFVQISSS